ncbi:MAG: 50S ribosomal protein L5 [Candidatus Harrisonbacteria bacterium CG10_big_fil_rev_8_21_14_0_10_45_28]|uniref:50S ribosomal protein L5 n=1 Tax=Candidatus Harrisonbacteria bacterium CG10_big_fil_rev_8_21_14_0_10_45_28 TaxID=1974586 RepID=A0A2H0UNV8_9BACT|nr:MAG: 50S ribosomal protein L5 [Candidatus Harrisonbacteria bacterium CG10_big_fil_rev_8_21_14_0_10_45_28]
MKNSLEKIVVNTSFGKQATAHADFEAKFMPEIKKELSMILGQTPHPRPAKKSIAGFKIREGMILGLRATLRGEKMKQFLERVVNIVIPRIRDFQGLKLQGVDGNGNYSFGIKEQLVFPEIILEESKVIFGMEITLVPRLPMDKEKALAFYRDLGLPLQKEKISK